MRVLGAFLFVLGGLAAAYCLAQAFEKPRPRDIAFAVAAPLCGLLAVLGLILIFVPEFLS